MVYFAASPPTAHPTAGGHKPTPCGAGSSVCPGRAEGPAGPVSLLRAHPWAATWGAGEKEIPACISWGGSCPPKLCSSVWPLFLYKLRWLTRHEIRKDLKAAGHSVPLQPRWAVQPAGKSLALNADKASAPWLSGL